MWVWYTVAGVLCVVALLGICVFAAFAASVRVLVGTMLHLVEVRQDLAGAASVTLDPRRDILLLTFNHGTPEIVKQRTLESIQGGLRQMSENGVSGTFCLEGCQIQSLRLVRDSEVEECHVEEPVTGAASVKGTLPTQGRSPQTG